MVKLFFKDKPIIGLDINYTGVKVMAINQKHADVRGYGSVDLDPVKTQEALDTDDHEYLREHIANMFRDRIIGSLPSNHVVIGLPTSRTYSRTFTLPASEEKHIASAAQLEVERYIPVPSDSLYTDYEIIKRTKETLMVVVSAAPRALVDTVTQVAKEVDLRPVAVEPSMNAVARILTKTEEGNRTTLVIDVGATSTDIAVLEDSAILITGSANVGGNNFTLDLASKMQVSLEKAHQYKVLNGLGQSDDHDKIEAALKPSLGRIVGEAKKVIRYYSERISEDKKIEQILIVGGGANMPGIGEYFTNAFILPARVASPWQDLDFGSLEKPHRQFRPRYITVAGLASVRPSEVKK